MMKPATNKARVMLAKLEALAERGIDGERESAARKAARLRARFDFTAAEEDDKRDLFKGHFKKSRRGAAILIHKFEPDCHLANAVKWAVETAAGIPCRWQGGELLAESAPGTAPRLKHIAVTISESFRQLWGQYSRLPGVNPADRGLFIMGLYDGMMNDGRPVGQKLPGRARVAKVPKAKKRAVAAPVGLHLHPYTVALEYGRQVRFTTPWEKIAGEIENLAGKLGTAAVLVKKSARISTSGGFNQ